MLVGVSAVGPFVGVVDVAQLGGEFAAGMLATQGQQSGGLTRWALEQSTPAAEVDRHPGGVDDDPTDVAGECCSEYVVGVQDHPVAGFAAALDQRLG